MASSTYEMPHCNDFHLSLLLEAQTRKAMVIELFIPTDGNPVKIPPHQMPATNRDEVQHHYVSAEHN